MSARAQPVWVRARNSGAPELCLDLRGGGEVALGLLVSL